LEISALKIWSKTLLPLNAFLVKNPLTVCTHGLEISRPAIIEITVYVEYVKLFLILAFEIALIAY
jgi:hypothetical protein